MVINRALLCTVFQLNKMSVHGSADLNHENETYLDIISSVSEEDVSLTHHEIKDASVTSSQVRVLNLELSVAEFVPGIH